jgi:hypothetical protein
VSYKHTPKIIFTTPFGNPASLNNLQRIKAVSEVNSEGLQTHVLPT